MSAQQPDQPRRFEIPIGVEIAAAWAWRILVIGAAVYGVGWLLAHFSEVTVPIAIALLLAALTAGAVDWLVRHRVPRIVATFAVVFGLIAVVTSMIAVIGQQLSTQFEDLRDSVVEGIAQLQDWFRNGPLGVSDEELGRWVDQLQKTIAKSDGQVFAQATHLGSQVGHFVTGFFIALFALFFFLYEGDRIWGWLVALFPKSSRAKLASSGVAAWATLTNFVRATVLVAFVDAVGIAGVALILNVPLAAAIGVLVFLGAFIPIIGALLSGMVAVLVALVAHGPVTALLMLAGVVAIQQLESHVLQPFIMGHLVAVHPLAIILAIAAGIVTAGIVGALLAVPFAACLNTVVKHLAGDGQSGAPEIGPDDPIATT